MARSILIVDDNAFVRQGLCEMFKREGILMPAERQKMDGRQLRRLSSCTRIRLC